MKIKILREFTGNTGAQTHRYEVGEVIELGTDKLSPSLLTWFERNHGFGEQIFDEKTLENAPENKMLDASSLENKSILNEIEEEDVKSEDSPESSTKEKITNKFNDIFNKTKNKRK